MIIRVIYKNGQAGTVLPDELEELLAKKRLYSFKRSDGWVEVEKGPLRSDPKRRAAEQERRAHQTGSAQAGLAGLESGH